jgi:hypothetical protein
MKLHIVTMDPQDYYDDSILLGVFTERAEAERFEAHYPQSTTITEMELDKWSFAPPTGKMAWNLYIWADGYYFVRRGTPDAMLPNPCHSYGDRKFPRKKRPGKFSHRHVNCLLFKTWATGVDDAIQKAKEKSDEIMRDGTYEALHAQCGDDASCDELAKCEAEWGVKAVIEEHHSEKGNL